MPSPDDAVRRRPDGSIDLDHSIALAHRARTEALVLTLSRAKAQAHRLLGSASVPDDPARP